MENFKNVARCAIVAGTLVLSMGLGVNSAHADTGRVAGTETQLSQWQERIKERQRAFREAREARAQERKAQAAVRKAQAEARKAAREKRMAEIKAKRAERLAELRSRRANGEGSAVSTFAGRNLSAAKSQTSRSAGKTARKGVPYEDLIVKYARAEGVPVALALAVVRVESNYRANARGRAGEVGLMQIKPATARGMGYRGSVKALYNPETNIRWGMKYLGRAHQLGGGSTCGTILKYNAGHYAKRMNKISANYCRKVKRYMV